MKKHATNITGFASLQDAAEEIGRMRYDALAEFLDHLKDEMETQQMNDRNKKRFQLVDDSYEIIEFLRKASLEANYLFLKYNKYMKDELDGDNCSSL